MSQLPVISAQPVSRKASKAVILLWILVAVLVALRFAHLAADFPNHTPWAEDQAKFTDEGWWANSAITHQLTNQWTIPGDYNPSAAVPVWTALLTLVFRATGISIVAARAVSVVFSVATIPLIYLLLRRGAKTHQLLASVAALLLAASPFTFAFARLAILDSCVLFQFCLLLLVASRLSADRRWRCLLLLAPLVTLLILTKTTSITLLPAVAWLAFSTLGFTLPNLATVVISFGILPGILLAGWYGVVRASGHLTDLTYFFETNAMDPFDLHALPHSLLHLLQNSLWVDPILMPLVLGLVVLACFRLRILWRNPLFSASVVALCGHTAYLIRRQDDTAPRYFLPLLVPVILIVILGLQHFWIAGRESGTKPWGTRICMALLGLTVLWHGFTIVDFIAHPTFAYDSALRDIGRIVDSDPHQRRLVLGVSAADLSLVTRIPSLNDAFGSDELNEKVARLQPGWFLAWNGVGDDIHAALPNLRFTPVAQYTVFDDPQRSPLILYRLAPNRP